MSRELDRLLKESRDRDVAELAEQGIEALERRARELDAEWEEAEDQVSLLYQMRDGEKPIPPGCSVTPFDVESAEEERGAIDAQRDLVKEALALCYRHTEYEDNPKIAVRAGKVTVDGKKLKELASEFGWHFPDDNVAVVGPIDRASAFMLNWPQTTYHVYVFNEPEERDAYADGIRAGGMPLMFQMPGMGRSPIDEIWKRRERKGDATAKGMIAVARVFIYDEPPLLYVDMMTVRPTAKRNRVNAALIATLMEIWPKRQLQFSNATNDGAAFIKWLREQGVEAGGGRR